MVFIDQTGFEVALTSVKRIVSIVPSQTELIADLGCADRLVGVTKFCVHPNGLIQKIGHVGGTKNLNLEKIRKLQPDLIIGNKEENTKEQIEELRAEFPVWMSDIVTLDQAINMIQDLGEILCVQENAHILIKSIQSVRNTFTPSEKKTALYFIWKDPMMVVGNQTFIHSMMEEAGLQNLGQDLGPRYPELNRDRLTIQPDWVLLSTEPYPFKQSDVQSFKDIFPDAKILLVDGELFSWYGSRMRLAFPYFKEVFENRKGLKRN
ncbi:MAG: helical backbone metal receptor [Crocinitomicaceae bacterium]